MQTIAKYFSGTEAYEALQGAFAESIGLMDTEYRAMRLISEAYGLPEEQWPQAVRQYTLTEEDAVLSEDGKIDQARQILFDQAYQSTKSTIMGRVEACTDGLLDTTGSMLGYCRSIFVDAYWKMVLGIILITGLSVMVCFVIRRYVILPLTSFGQSIEKGTLLPVEGAMELREMAATYNTVFQENQETQKLMRHQAERDGLTDLLNRRAFDQLMRIYEAGDRPFVLHVADVDQFKHFNDAYGHAVGDEVLKKVAQTLKNSFRATDYVCRIGGDEFAVIMVDMPLALRGVAESKLRLIRGQLIGSDDGVPGVTLSIGAAFSESVEPGKTIFNAADEALYQVKENGRNGYRIYGD